MIDDKRDECGYRRTCTIGPRQCEVPCVWPLCLTPSRTPQRAGGRSRRHYRRGSCRVADAPHGEALARVLALAIFLPDEVAAPTERS